LSGAHKAVEALGPTCIGVWASRSHGSCCRHRGPKSAGSMSPEACLLVLGYLEPQQLLEVPRNPAFRQQEFWACFQAWAPRRAVQ
jgi:hypothetical protein